MNLDDDFGLAEPLGEALVLAAELLEFRIEGMVLGLGAALAGGEGLEDAGLAFAPPGDEMGGVQALAAQQGADGAGEAGVVGLLEDAELVFGGEGTAPGFGDDLGIGTGEGPQLGGGFARRCAALALTTLGLTALRGGQNRWSGKRLVLETHAEIHSRPAQ